MPYKFKKDLPDSVREALPAHAETIYKEAFNNAWRQYKDPEKRRGGISREEVSHKIAWSAVKKVYKKVGDKWVRKEEKKKDE